MLIIGLHGKKQAGKDYTAGLLLRFFIDNGANAVMLRFAERVYKYAELAIAQNMSELTLAIESDIKIIDISTSERPEDLAKKCLEAAKSLKEQEHGKPRRLLQFIGTDIFRNQVSCDYWVKIIKAQIDKLPKNNVVIIPDVRFNNEAAICTTVIHILGGITGDTHLSENEKIDCEYTLNNQQRDEKFHKEQLVEIFRLLSLRHTY